MISVDDLYNHLLDNLKKNQGGHISNIEFNKLLVSLQNDLMDFYESLGFTRNLTAVQPFLKTVAIAGGSAVLPSDFRYRLGGKATWLTQGPSGPVQNEFPAKYLHPGSEYDNLHSPIRRPDLDKCVIWYKLDENGITYYPATGVTLTVSYIRYPAVASRAVTVDTVNQVENYNAGGTTDLEWPSSEYKKCIEVLSYYAGIQVDDSAIVQWLAAKTVKEK